MTKRKSIESKSRRSAVRGGDADAKKSSTAETLPTAADAWFSPAAIRETVESVIIAFVLAFLFRTFEAEAFVIPTGSMAPTLMGKHKDLECPQCHYRYQVSASDNPRNDRDTLIYRGTCPMCRYTADLTPANPQGKDYPSYDGDRILVAKFPYEFAEPKRWDVIVFKYPNNSTMNYIKRLVGLPGETIEIRDGDLWIKPADPKGKLEIARKPPEKILAMLQPVYDNDLAPTISGTMRWPQRWTAENGPGSHGWTNGKEGSAGKPDLASFEIDGEAAGEAWIRYRHRVPTPEDWDDKDAAKPPPESLPPQLITDFTAYNTGESDQSLASGASVELLRRGCGQHWVGDLAVQFELESRSASGKVVAELVKGGCRFECRFDLSDGSAELAISKGGVDALGYHRTAKAAIAGAGRHRVIFANVDSELTLWVDGRVVNFQQPGKADAQPPRAQASVDEHPNGYDCRLLDDRIPTLEDLSPVGIAAAGAAVKVSHIKVLRDVYYIAVFNKGGTQKSGKLQDFKRDNDMSMQGSWEYLSDFRLWPSYFSEENMKQCTIEIKPKTPGQPEKDQFFVLGDNSPQSSDGRLWDGEWWVDRELLIGKALFIYWPHGWPVPYLRLPVYPVPDFPRMHFVR